MIYVSEQTEQHALCVYHFDGRIWYYTHFILSEEKNHHPKLTKSDCDKKTRILLRENSQRTRKKCSQFIDHNNRSAWLISHLVLIYLRWYKKLARSNKARISIHKPKIKFTFILIGNPIVLSFERDLVRVSSIKFIRVLSNSNHFFLFFYENNGQFSAKRLEFRVCVASNMFIDVIYDILFSDWMAMVYTPRVRSALTQSIH